MDNLWIIHLYSLPVFLLGILLLSIFNILKLKKLSSFTKSNNQPFVSILIPARNEEKNIKHCITSLLKQNYPNKEIIVLNDQSSDGTLEVLEKIKLKNPHLKIIQGKALPSGWLGKNWACHQLFMESRGELLFFTDADTYHLPSMLENAVSAFLQEKADMMTALVRLELGSFGEKLIVPFIYWSVITFFPIWLAEKFKIKGLSASTGQFLLFKRKALERIGEYQGIRKDVVDDFQMGRKIIQQKMKWVLADATEEINCRMYTNIQQAIAGFTKNFFPVFNYNIPLYIFVFFYLLLVYLQPIFVLILKLIFVSLTNLSFIPLILCIIISTFQHGLAYWKMKVPVWLAFLYPISILLAVYTAIKSLVANLNHTVVWKGRSIGG
jgi:chlorobactene glucosyltransferase